ncbi:MAG: DUF2239 family protein [Phenylobacterium sp.]|nr:MAG: DUF2239 family protein [Phenylobacterium sp.]
MNEITSRACTAFDADRRIAAGPLAAVAQAVRTAVQAGAEVLVFDDATGRVIDLDLRGSAEDVAARLPALAAAFPAASPSEAAETMPGPRGRGRPKLGVVAREVTLLPRHWEWLAAQPGGASVALRKLVEAARREAAGPDAARSAREAAYRVLSALAGDRPGFEAATRALFAGDSSAFASAVGAWPQDVGAYVIGLARL